jgi:hypothetical protein
MRRSLLFPLLLLAPLAAFADTIELRNGGERSGAQGNSKNDTVLAALELDYEDEDKR